MIGIYKIQSSIKPDRIYIGSAINITDRWRVHLRDLKKKVHHSSKLQHHYNKYGETDLIFSILLTCDKEDLIKIEQYFLDAYYTYFNICKIAGSSLGYRHSETTKLKMKKPLSESHKKKLSEARMGKIPWNKGQKLPPLSEETRKKQSMALRGRNIPEEVKQKLRKPKSSEHKQHIREGWQKRNNELKSKSSK